MTGKQEKVSGRRVSLDSLSLPVLDGLLAFEVHTEESNPNEAGPLAVTIDCKGITLRWVGEKKPGWAGTWTELRELIDYWDVAAKNFADAEQAQKDALALFKEAENELARAKGVGVVLPMVTP